MPIRTVIFVADLCRMISGLGGEDEVEKPVKNQVAR